MKQKVIECLQSLITNLEDPSVEISDNSFSAEEEVEHHPIAFRGRVAQMLTGNKDIIIKFTVYDPKLRTPPSEVFK